MEEKELREFSWTLCFYVTGLSFLVFSFALKLLEADHTSLFLKVGLAGLALGVLSSLNKMTGKKITKHHTGH